MHTALPLLFQLFPDEEPRGWAGARKRFAKLNTQLNELNLNTFLPSFPRRQPFNLERTKNTSQLWLFESFASTPVTTAPQSITKPETEAVKFT